MRLTDALAETPLVAILRGLHPDAAVAIGQQLYEAGFRAAEVPLNRPHAIASIERLAAAFAGRMAIGAGTVVECGQPMAVAAAGGSFCVSPNIDVAIIRAILDCGLDPVPGFETASEAYRAHEAGARLLKYFPAATQLGKLRDIVSILPPGCEILAVGGMADDNAAEAIAAGAVGIGVGSALWRAGDPPERVAATAAAMVRTIRTRVDRPSLLVEAGACIGESPVWKADPERVIWTDPLSCELLTWHVEAERLERQKTPEPFWTLVDLDDGSGPLAALSDDALYRATADGEWRLEGRFALPPGCRFNDAAASPDGRIAAGIMHRGLLSGTGRLAMLDPTAMTMTAIVEGLDVPNGVVFDSRGDLFVIDTKARTLLEVPRAGDGMGWDPPRIISDFMGQPGKPDGMILAPDGHSFLVAMWGGAGICRVSRAGGSQWIPIAARNPSALVAAPDHRIFLTTSRMRLERPKAEDGALLRLAPL